MPNVRQFFVVLERLAERWDVPTKEFRDLRQSFMPLYDRDWAIPRLLLESCCDYFVRTLVVTSSMKAIAARSLGLRRRSSW